MADFIEVQDGVFQRKDNIIGFTEENVGFRNGDLMPLAIASSRFRVWIEGQRQEARRGMQLRG